MSEGTRRGIEVVAGLIFRDECLLACQRSAASSFPFRWEFPGGKVEHGEDYLSALRRELREELGIEVLNATQIHCHSYEYPNLYQVNLRFFHVREYAGKVTNRVFQEIRWVPVRRLTELDFLEADRSVIETILRAKVTT